VVEGSDTAVGLKNSDRNGLLERLVMGYFYAALQDSLI